MVAKRSERRRRCGWIARATLSILVAVVLCGPAAAVTLVEEGAPKVLLIVEADSPKALKAGEAIQGYVQKMSGTKLPLLTDRKSVV